MAKYQTERASRLLIRHRGYKLRSLGSALGLMSCERVEGVEIIWTRAVEIDNVTTCFEKMIGRYKGNLYKVDLVNYELLTLPPKIDCEKLHIPLFIEDIYGYTWMIRFRKVYENVYIPLPKPGPMLQIPHVASLSVINRHIAPITIPNDEIYKYVASNLDFSETF